MSGSVSKTLRRSAYLKVRKRSQIIFCFIWLRKGYRQSMDASMMKRLKELEDENKRLKKMYAEERLKAEIRKEALEGKL